MKLISLLLTSFLLLEANSISWRSNFDEAHHQAIRESKNLMVLLLEKDSLVNKSILINTFMNQDYIDKINEKYIWAPLKTLVLSAL